MADTDIYQQVGKLQGAIEILTAQSAALPDQLDARFARWGERIGKLEQRVETIHDELKDDMNDLCTRLTLLEKKNGNNSRLLILRYGGGGAISGAAILKAFEWIFLG